MFKSLVYSASKKHLLLRGRLLTLNRAAKLLKRTRPTLMEWIKQDLVVPFETERQGKRVNQWFENEYIAAIAQILPPTTPGGPVLDENLKAAIDGINRRFGKHPRRLK